MHHTEFPHAWHPVPLFFDDHIIAVNKPANMLSVPGKGPDKQDCLAARVGAEFPGALTIHRLDYATSGIILLARNADAHRAMGRLFETRQVHKRYMAVVAGLVVQESGQIDQPLICDWPNRPLQKVDHEHGKPAMTRYQRLDINPHVPCSRLLLTPVTGRSHQLRVHLQWLGHPILGDEFYAPSEVRQLSRRLLLHAEHIEFVHPLTGALIKIECPAEF